MAVRAGMGIGSYCSDGPYVFPKWRDCGVLPQEAGGGYAGRTMTTTNSWMMVLSQFLGQAPTLLIYLAGIVLCAVWWRRAPRAAMLALIGTGILLATSVAVTLATVYYINNRAATPVSSLSMIMTFIGIGGSVLRAVGFGLVLFAVFAQRPPVAQHSGFEVQQAYR
jgi:hypothetical protein